MCFEVVQILLHLEAPHNDDGSTVVERRARLHLDGEHVIQWRHHNHSVITTVHAQLRTTVISMYNQILINII